MVNNCEHDLQFVVKIISNGQKRLTKQCLKCGLHNGEVFKNNTVQNINDLPLFNEELKEEYYKKSQLEYQQKRESERRAWLQNYSLYLDSQKWHDKRKKVLERDKYLCQGCLSNKATQVHHLSYKNVYNEMLFELISVCNKCHETIHNNEKTN